MAPTTVTLRRFVAIDQGAARLSGWLVGYAALGTSYVCWSFARDYIRLYMRPHLACPPAEQPHELVSLLIPARNEERAIERCVVGALAQRPPVAEVLVLDDGSCDRTPAIVGALAQRDARLRVLAGQPLPPGWTGKCYACHQLAAQASGDWLLFLDADTAPQPDLVAALLAHARQQRLDVVTLFPFLELDSFWERALLPPFLAVIAAVFPFERMANPHARPDEVLANGQCILVRRAAYEQVGGHGAVCGEVLEDVRLAQRLRTAGYTIGGGDGSAFLRVRMYTSGREVAEGLMKHAAAGARSGGGRTFLGVGRVIITAFTPFTLLALGGWMLARGPRLAAWFVAAAGLTSLAVALSFWAALLRRLYRLPARYALVFPFGLLCYLLIALRGMWRVRRGRGVVWKGRSYAG